PWLLIGGQPVSALIVSPPGLGKTTMLRDAGRALSLRGHAVAMVDERSELAACVGGVPTLDLGPNTDVLDGCPKAEGMRLVLRAMAPRVIVTDEIGHAGDAEAVLDAARCGVAVLASAHGRDYHDLEVRPMLSALLGARVFARIAALDRIGHIGAVYGAEGESLA
ncbi:MAG: stage III sporulation protein AA, partial [Firmicutes bacterium]|nr:stage III sporulation protein AA [Bacillota bacterium]